jgi:hypothetical protein
VAKEYDNNMTGVLFKNDKKTSPKHPDYNGSCEINNVEFWMSAWIKEVKNGEKAGQKFMSFAFKPKDSDGIDQRPTNERQSQQPANDEIPF